MEKKIYLKFYPAKRLNSKEEAPIYLRITIDGDKAEAATGVSCKPELWDIDTQRIKSKPLLNDQITKVDSNIKKIIKRLEVEEKNITPFILKNLLVGNQTGKRTLMNYIKYYYLKYVINSVEKVEGTKDNYKTTYETHLPNYLKYKYNQKGTPNSDNISNSVFKNSDDKADIFLINCDIEFVEDFGYWLINIDNKSKNTSANHHKKLNTLLDQAVIEKEITDNPYENYKIKKEKKYVHKLDREQLNVLETHDLGGNKSLQEVRDCFLFSTYTGLRITIAFDLRKEQIILKDDKYWIRTKKEQEKTNMPLERPLLNKAKEIADKYKDIQEITGKILPQRAQTKVNLYLKTIANLTGVDIGEPLHFHHARHTFATLICIENDIPIDATMKFLGHLDIRSTMIYADIRREMLEKYAEKMNEKNAENDKKRNKNI